MNARENRMRIAREARAESPDPIAHGQRRRDEMDPNRLLVNSNDIRYAESMRNGTIKDGKRYRYLNGKVIQY